MKNLRHLNLESNEFHGNLSFNHTFIKRMFKVDENSNLCYNHIIFSSKLKLGITSCDKHGLLLSLSLAKDEQFIRR